jgi:hypothetical protein
MAKDVDRFSAVRATCQRQPPAAHLWWRLTQSTDGRYLVRFHSVENNLHAGNCVTGHQACLAGDFVEGELHFLAEKQSDVRSS